MKRNKTLLLTVLVLALALVSVVPTFGQGETLVIWGDNTRAPILAELAEEFEEEFDVAVEVQEVEFGDIRDDLLVAGPEGLGPDILVGAHDWLGQLVTNGAVVPLDLGDLTEDFLPAAVEAFTFNGEVWGMPYAIENVALIRNVDLVPEAPATWEEVRAVSEALAEDDVYGFLARTGDFYHNFPIITAFGGYLFGFNEDGSYNPADVGLTTDGGLAAAEWLGGMYADGLMVPDVDDDVSFELFEAGELGMFITGPWYSERLDDSGVNFSIDPLPGAEGGLENGRPFSGVQGLMISAFSENQLLAEDFLFNFVADEDIMADLSGGRGPVFEGADIDDDNITAFLAAGTEAVPMPAIPEMGAVWAPAGDALTLISNGSEPVETFTNAYDQIQSNIALAQSEERIVGLPGSHQAAAGCPGDWDPACDVTFFEDQGDGIYTLTITLPAGDYEYKVAMNGGWDENYGVDGVADGDNYTLSLTEETEITFTYDDNTNVVTNSVDGM